jgi:hypothetical protein
LIGPSAVVMMVVDPTEKNVFDQRRLEYTLFNQFRIKKVSFLSCLGE